MKCCYLFLPFSLFTAICASFAFLKGRAFSVLKHSMRKYLKFETLQVIIRAINTFSKLNLAWYHYLHKNLQLEIS